MDDKRVRQIHLLWRDRGSCMAPMAYNELAGMMSKALEQLQMFKSKVSVSAGASEASSPIAVSDAACQRLRCAPGCASSVCFTRASSVLLLISD
jgi:hypothetical protein